MDKSSEWRAFKALGHLTRSRQSNGNKLYAATYFRWWITGVVDGRKAWDDGDLRVVPSGVTGRALVNRLHSLIYPRYEGVTLPIGSDTGGA